MIIIKISIKLVQTKTVDKYSRINQSEKIHNLISSFFIVYVAVALHLCSLHSPVLRTLKCFAFAVFPSVIPLLRQFSLFVLSLKCFAFAVALHLNFVVVLRTLNHVVIAVASHLYSLVNEVNKGTKLLRSLVFPAVIPLLRL